MTGARVRGFLWKGLLAAGLLAFLAYGLSAFFVKPTAETITTRPPPPSGPDNRPMQNVNYTRRRRTH